MTQYDSSARSPRDHAFVRSDNPHFGSAFGGACDADLDGVAGGWPESVHPTADPEAEVVPPEEAP